MFISKDKSEQKLLVPKVQYINMRFLKLFLRFWGSVSRTTPYICTWVEMTQRDLQNGALTNAIEQSIKNINMS